MKRNLLSIALIGLVASSVAQQQFENAGFENWENLGAPTEEPNDWSSIKTSDVSSLNSLAPQVVSRSTDAHSGSYSLLVENKSAGFGIVANGIVSNGRIHADLDPELGYVFTDGADGQWNTSFASRPDSLVGWYKYNPSGADQGKVDVILHTTSGFDFPGDENGVKQVGRARFDIPNTTISTWKRFAVPFHYNSSDAPEYILAVLTSGDSTQAVNGSKAWFDDLELIYNVASVEDLSAEEMKVSTDENRLKLWALNGWNQEVRIELYDLQGRVVSNTIWNAGNDLEWNLPEINGIHLLKYYVEDRVLIKKVFIK